MTEITVPDSPTSQDALDFMPYARALANIAKTGGTPLTIGVFGGWGSGKTSLMEMIKDNLPGTYTKVWFNAWKYDKEATLWRAFLTAVLNAMKEKAEEDGAPAEEFDKLQSLLYRSMEFEKLGGVKIDLPQLAGQVGKSVVNFSLSFLPGGDVLKKLSEALQSNSADSLNEAADAISRERTKLYVEQISSLEQFQKRFAELVQTHILEKDSRLVVFVDDLDRCLPEKAVEVLEAIKLFLDAPGCVFMLGLDQDVIARGIEIKYKELDSKQADGGARFTIEGLSYLEKIIQLPFILPSVESAQMDSFVQGLMETWENDECPKVFALGLGSNPRQIKRTVNTFLMLSSVAREKHNSLAPIRLAKVVTIQNVFPELYKFIAQYSRRHLRDLEQYFRAKQDAEQKRETAVMDGGGRESVEIKQEQANLEPPAALRDFFKKRDKIDALERILTMHASGLPEANFADLPLEEIDPYFTLTARAEAPASPVVESAVKKSAASPSRNFEPTMVNIPAGKFLMGSDESNDEKPPREVDLPTYSIGKYPITNREYQAFVRATSRNPPRDWEGENFPPEKAEHPVAWVKWNDAVDYCTWLSKETGKQYRLPSEAEWEKAARGTDGRRYPWGDDFDSKNCNTQESGIGDTSEVGRFSPRGDSPYGCADMAGNVWEWTRSVLKKYPYDPNDGREDENASGSRALRGGSFFSNQRYARCAYRFENFYVLLSFDGFRVCASPVSPESS
ncbi:MAG: SUMF1/EgtB/PvdO family nonheme iron enzyme [Anaerolineaceae bacterium]|nr:SUMF1/EgtB/PvdO family nonheme iron enzyme [Anaerolineaceae bacterium]